MNKSSPASKGFSAAATSEVDTCADAVDKIESALTLSSNFMKASGEKPTIGDIQAVLVTLQESLGSECADDDDEDDDDEDRKVKRDGVLDGLLGGDDDDNDEEESVLENYLQYCGCKGLEESVAVTCLQECASDGMAKLDDGAKTKRQLSSDGTDPLAALSSLDAQELEAFCEGFQLSQSSMQGQQENDEDVVCRVEKLCGYVLDGVSDSNSNSESKTLVTRETGCSDCERQLYQIVQQLLDIFSIAGDLEPSVPDVPVVPDTDLPDRMPQINDTKVVAPAVNATTLAPAQLRRRALHMART